MNTCDKMHSKINPWKKLEFIHGTLQFIHGTLQHHLGSGGVSDPAAENAEKVVRSNQLTADFKVREDFAGPDSGRYWTESSPALALWDEAGAS